MSAVEKAFAPVFYLIRHQKKMVLLALGSAVAFAVLLFPYDDLSDKITDLISKYSQNQVFLQFDELGISFLPPALKMSNVVVEAQFLPTSLKASTLKLAPSVAGFLAFSPGFTADIEDVMNGDIEITHRAGKKINDSTQMQKVDLDLSGLDLKKLAQFSGLPISPEGSVTVDLSSSIDPNFVEQPEGDLGLQIAKFRLPPATVPTPLGPLALPNIQLSSIQMKALLKGGDLAIEDGVIGNQGDTINGRFKGRLGLRLVRQGNQVVPEFGAYEFKIDMQLDKEAEKNFGVFLSFIDKYKSATTGKGTRYQLKLSAPNTRVPPTPSPMGSF